MKFKIYLSELQALTTHLSNQYKRKPKTKAIITVEELPNYLAVGLVIETRKGKAQILCEPA